MRTGNTADGMYFFLLVVPFIVSFFFGEVLRKTIISHLAIDGVCSQRVSILLGNLAEVLVIITGISAGILLVKLV